MDEFEAALAAYARAVRSHRGEAETRQAVLEVFRQTTAERDRLTQVLALAIKTPTLDVESRAACQNCHFLEYQHGRRNRRCPVGGGVFEPISELALTSSEA